MASGKIGADTSSQKPPNPVDIYVGKRLRLRRSMLGMSQADLGRLVGITFQQIQKYERGTNRIYVSRLHQFSKILNTEFGWFIEGLDEGHSEESPITREITTLIRIYNNIPEKLRKPAVWLLKAISGMENKESC